METELKRDQIIEVESAYGVRFRVGDRVGHQDTDSGEAEILDFRMSASHPPEIEAITTKGTAHVQFLVELTSPAPSGVDQC